MALATGHRCLDHRVTTIAASVFYSTLFPPECMAAVLARTNGSVPEQKLAMTAAGFPGLSGAPLRGLSSAIYAERLACGLNGYFWKQQDLSLDPDDFASTLALALR